VKRREFIREIINEGCYLERHRRKHDIYVNSFTGRRAPVPRHSEIKESLCQLIKKQLKI